MILRLTDAYLAINYLVRIFMEKVGIKIPIFGSTIKKHEFRFYARFGKVYA